MGDTLLRLSRSPLQFRNVPLPKNIEELEFNDHIAVPINYGMLSYFFSYLLIGKLLGRSPHQLWNALLPFACDKEGIAPGSQSPLIMECSPTSA